MNEVDTEQGHGREEGRAEQLSEDSEGEGDEVGGCWNVNQEVTEVTKQEEDMGEGCDEILNHHCRWGNRKKN